MNRLPIAVSLPLMVIGFAAISALILGSAAAGIVWIMCDTGDPEKMCGLAVAIFGGLAGLAGAIGGAVAGLLIWSEERWGKQIEADKTVLARTSARCPACKGSGKKFMEEELPCPVCSGTGQVSGRGRDINLR